MIARSVAICPPNTFHMTTYVKLSNTELIGTDRNNEASLSLQYPIFVGFFLENSLSILSHGIEIVNMHKVVLN